jgi:arylsulfatase A-like enzyme
VWPRKYPEPRVVDTPAVTTDYMPSILGELGIDLPSDRPYDGVNLFELLDTPGMERSKPIGFIHNKKMAWTTKRYKVYSNDLSKEDKFQLFDLQADPQEKNDLAKTKPEVLAKMVGQFRPWYEGVMADLAKIED